MDTTIALLLHYYSGLTLNDVLNMSVRQIHILVNEVATVSEIFMGGKKKSSKSTKEDIEVAKQLGCKNPERLLEDGR